MIISHFLFGLIVVGVPVVNVYAMRQLQKATNRSTAKMMGYLFTTISLWFMTALVFIPHSLHDIFYFTPLVKINLISKIVISLLIVYLLLITIVPLLLLRSQRVRLEASAALAERSLILPVSKQEKGLFWLVALSVGVCEEIIFRAFLVQYLYEHFFGYSLLICFIVAALIFGLGHFHQGVNGVFNATIFALVMSFCLVTTRNLALPIVLHIIYDLKVLFLPQSHEDMPITST